MGAEATLPLRPGDLVAGRYEVDRVLGVGGMGAVVAATDVESGERVAIKCLLLEHTDHDDVVARFQREARATTRLQSEHVARVFDSGALVTGVPYIVMEHLEGRDLKSLVKSQGALSVKDAAAYVCQACVALAEAHALGIVHRDLKPANLFLTRRPNGSAMIKVLDFGIAKFLSPNIAGDQLEMTRTRSVLGSRAYMSPEQMLRPKEVDTRSDIWALGVILHYLVTGRSPFAAETIEALILNVVQEEPAPLGDVPPGFEAVVLRCLAKERGHRFPNVTELSRALGPFAKDASLSSDRCTVELPPPPRPIEQSAPSVRGFSVTSDAPTETRSEAPTEESRPSDPEADTRVSVPSWAPTRVMLHKPSKPRQRRRAPAAPRLLGAVVLGFLGALLLIHRLAPAVPARSAVAAEMRPAPVVSAPSPVVSAPTPVATGGAPVASVAPSGSASAEAAPVTSAAPSAPSAPSARRAPVKPPAPRPRPRAADLPW